MTPDTTATTPMDPDDLALLMGRPDATDPCQPLTPAMVARLCLAQRDAYERLLAAERERSRVTTVLWRAERTRSEALGRMVDGALMKLRRLAEGSAPDAR